MLPKSFQKQNIISKNKLVSKLKIYTITYDYELSRYYGEYIKESYNLLGNVIDSLGKMKLTGYDIDEVEFNFHQIMTNNYINSHKIMSYNILNISEESFISKPIS